MDAAEGFAQYEFGSYGDKRIGIRVSKTLLAFWKSGKTKALPALGRHPSKLYYRMLKGEKLTCDALNEVTLQITTSEILKQSCEVILVPQDTVEISLDGLRKTEGLGWHGKSTKNLGLMVHSAIALSETGTPLGMVYQTISTRSEEDCGKGHTENKYKPIEEKESFRWIETLRATKVLTETEKRIINICDREGDIYGLFAESEKNQSIYLCRCLRNRQIAGDSSERKAFEAISKLPSAGNMMIHIPRNSHSDKKARTAVLNVRFGAVTILKPKQSNLPAETVASICANIIIVEEEHCGKGEKPLSWKLITNEEIHSLEDAVRLVGYYKHRWKIERFHYALKTGYCKIEDMQYSTMEKLKKVVSIYSILAMQLLILTYAARNTPGAPCTDWLNIEEFHILWCIANKTKRLPSHTPTIHDAVRLIALLGGFVVRGADSEPGILVILRGLVRLHDALEFAPWLRP